MVLFSPLVWHHQYLFLRLPLLLLLVHSSTLIRTLGVATVFLIQRERYYEHYVQWLPWPTAIATLVILAAVYVLFVRLHFKQLSFRRASV